MQYMSFDKDIVKDTLLQICEAMEQLIDWNKNISTPDDYATTPDGVKTLAATCMLIEAIGEGIKKIEKRTNGTLLNNLHPDIPWKEIMGMRDHIAHGYFQIDAEFVFDTVSNDLKPLQIAIEDIIRQL